MEILIEISEGADGRLAGTVQAPDGQDVRSFSGTMEFLAAVERLCRAEPAIATTPTEKDN